MQISERTRAISQAFLVTFLWSTSWVLIKNNLQEIPPLIFAGTRYLMAALILLPGLLIRRVQLSRLSKKQWFQLGLLGVIFYTLTQGGLFMTLNHLEAITFSLLMNFSTVLVALFGIIGLREIPTRLQWLGIAVFIFGVLLYFFPLAGTSGSMVGFILAGFTLSTDAVSSLLGRAINRQRLITPMVVTGVSMGIGAIALLGTGLIVEEFPTITLKNFLVLVWLAVVNTAFAFTLWNRTLQILTAVESSIIVNTMLIQIALQAWIFLGERPGLWGIVGLCLAAIGILLANLRITKIQSDKDDKQSMSN